MPFEPSEDYVPGMTEDYERQLYEAPPEAPPPPAPAETPLAVCLDCELAAGPHVHIDEGWRIAVRYPTGQEWLAALAAAHARGLREGREECRCEVLDVMEGGGKDERSCPLHAYEAGVRQGRLSGDAAATERACRAVCAWCADGRTSYEAKPVPEFEIYVHRHKETGYDSIECKAWRIYRALAATERGA